MKNVHCLFSLIERSFIILAITNEIWYFARFRLLETSFWKALRNSFNTRPFCQQTTKPHRWANGRLMEFYSITRALPIPMIIDRTIRSHNFFSKSIFVFVFFDYFYSSSTVFDSIFHGTSFKTDSSKIVISLEKLIGVIFDRVLFLLIFFYHLLRIQNEFFSSCKIYWMLQIFFLILNHHLNRMEKAEKLLNTKFDSIFDNCYWKRHKDLTNETEHYSWSMCWENIDTQPFPWRSICTTHHRGWIITQLVS